MNTLPVRKVLAVTGRLGVVALLSNAILCAQGTSTPDFATAPYAIPTAANGKVYVPTYGLCNQFNSGVTCIASDGYTLSGVQVYK
jgi:hypothetical protein